MADEPTLEIVTPPAAAAPAEAAPPPEPPPAPSAAEAAPPSTPEAAPAATQEGTAAPAAEAEAPKTVADTPSMLEEIAEPEKAAAPEGEKKDEAKPAEAEKPTEVKADEKPADEGEKAAEPPPAPVLDPIEWGEAYKLPETIQLDDTGRAELHTALDAFRADPKANAQQLIDLHSNYMQQYAERVAQQQQDAFLQTRAEWRKQVMDDPEFGGTKWDESRTKIAGTRNMLVSDAEPGSERYVREWKEWNDLCRYTGAGDHPALFRFLNNAAKVLGEASAPSGEIRPAPTGRERKRGLLYNNPTSPNNRQ